MIQTTRDTAPPMPGSPRIGFARILSQPHYPNRVENPAVALLILEHMIGEHRSGYSFWSDSVSLLDRTLFHATAIHGPRQITDVYLLGLCQRNSGVFVSLDHSVSVSAIVAPRADLLRLL